MSAMANLKTLEYEAGATIGDEAKAMKDAKEEEVELHKEQAKYKALEEERERKAAEFKEIEEREAKLITEMNEKSAGDDMVAERVPSKVQDRELSMKIEELPKAFAGVKGGDIFDKLVNAKAAGLGAVDIAAASAKAQKMASDELKQAVAATHHDATRLKLAFANAAKAGVADKDARSSVLAAAKM